MAEASSELGDTFVAYHIAAEGQLHETKVAPQSRANSGRARRSDIVALSIVSFVNLNTRASDC